MRKQADRCGCGFCEDLRRRYPEQFGKAGAVAERVERISILAVVRLAIAGWLMIGAERIVGTARRDKDRLEDVPELYEWTAHGQWCRICRLPTTSAQDRHDSNCPAPSVEAVIRRERRTVETFGEWLDDEQSRAPLGEPRWVTLREVSATLDRMTIGRGGYGHRLAEATSTIKCLRAELLAVRRELDAARANPGDGHREQQP